VVELPELIQIMTFSILVARKELMRYFARGRDEPTLCHLPVDPLDTACGAMAQIDKKISDLAKKIILYTSAVASWIGEVLTVSR
jgi:hypothetical protein